MNRSIPNCTVIPEVPYDDIARAVDWLHDAFGFTLRIRIADHRAQLNVGDGAIVLVERRGNPAQYSVMVRVPDVDAHYARALRAGAEIVQHPADHPYGERQYAARDHEGHRWKFSQSIADVPPEAWGGETGHL